MRTASGSRLVRSTMAVGLVASSVVLLGACGGGSSSASATSEATASRSASASVAGLPVRVLSDRTFTCPSESGYVTDVATNKDPQGNGHTAIFLGYCGAGTQKLEANPAVTLLDAGGKPVDVAVDHSPVTSDDLRTIQREMPVCVFLDWQGAGTAGSGVKGSRVEVAAASGRSAFTLDLPIEFGRKPALTVSQWTAASGTASSCVGSN